MRVLFRILFAVVAATVLDMNIASKVYAHTARASNMVTDKTSIHVGTSTTWRSNGAADDFEAWRIPGVMMGGDSWPVERGLSVDEFNLTLTHQLDSNFYSVIKVGSHSGGLDHSSIHLEHLFMGWRGRDRLTPLSIEAGTMSAIFSPALSEHASSRIFSETSLALDAFLGRHFHDDGVRVLWQSPAGITAGIEYWRGKNFPATPISDGGNTDLFARYDWQNNYLVGQLGFWAMAANAEFRGDHRYADGHQHNDAFISNVPDVRFSGDTILTGMNGKLIWQLMDALDWEIQGELIRVEADGQIIDAIRTASINSDYVGSWLQSSIRWHKHTFSVRAEELILENRVLGPGAPQLVMDSGLDNEGDNPSRITLSWYWQWRNSIALRVEGVNDQATINERSRLGIGLVWREKIWSR